MNVTVEAESRRGQRGPGCRRTGRRRDVGPPGGQGPGGKVCATVRAARCFAGGTVVEGV